MTSFCDKTGSVINGMIGQLLVASFLFYSGYGVMTSIKKKGADYVRSIPKKRILQTLLNFDVAVCLFIILDLCLKKDLTIYKTLFAFVGWTSVGNSNWYILIILLCYVTTFAVFARMHDYSNNISITIGACKLLAYTCVIWIILWRTKQTWYYNTILCYPAGVFYAIWKQKIEDYVMKHYGMVSLVITSLFILLYNIPYDFAQIKYNIISILFSLIVILITMRLKIGNFILYWLGANLFPLYIYQRIPMLALSEIQEGVLPREYTTIYILLCFTITIGITLIYRFIEIKIK